MTPLAHVTGPPATGAPEAPGIGPVLGWLDGHPLPRTALDHRLAALRAGPRAATLPPPGTPESRQLTRWLAQVLLTEHLCTTEATTRALDLDAFDPGAPAPIRLDERAAVELGSVIAAAYEHHPAVRALFTAVTADVTVPDDQVHAYWRATARPVPRRWRLLLAPDPTPQLATEDSLPAALANALRHANPGATITAAGWTAHLLESLPPTTPDYETEAPALHAHLLASARRLTFVRWLDQARAHRLRLVPGLEHPGDPRQPDNHHRH